MNVNARRTVAVLIAAAALVAMASPSSAGDVLLIGRYSTPEMADVIIRAPAAVEVPPVPAPTAAVAPTLVPAPAPEVAPSPVVTQKPAAVVTTKTLRSTVTPPEVAPVPMTTTTDPASAPVQGPTTQVAPPIPPADAFTEWLKHPTFTCEPGRAPGWLNEQGIPTGCVAN